MSGARPPGVAIAAPGDAATRRRPLVRAIGAATGKVILLGEHAVVHGQPALVAGLDLGVRVAVEPRGELPRSVPGADPRLAQAVDAAAARLGIAPETSFAIAIEGELPVAMGLGSSAALCVALLRGLAAASGTALELAALSAHAHALEALFHGTPSGVDSTAATYGGVLRFLAGPPPRHERVRLGRDLGLVVLLAGERHDTGRTVGSLRERVAARPEVYRPVLAAIGGLVDAACGALERGDQGLLGELMTMNHGLLAACGISTPALDDAVALALRCGALGAKLTGGGGGGAVVALAGGDPHPLAQALRERQVDVIAARIEGEAR